MEETNIIDLNTKAAHAFIPAKTGAGKTTLAKMILINNRPEKYMVFTENKSDWNNVSQDIEDLEKFYSAVKIMKERDNSPDVQKKKYIVVFDDFNNQAEVNMWTNKTVNAVFTEGRKYNFHAILLAHTTRDTGKTIRNMCHYTIAFKPSNVSEMHNLARDFLLGDTQTLIDNLKVLKSRYDFLVIASGNITPCCTDVKEKKIKKIEASQNQDFELNVDTSIRNMGNNNTINQSNNIVNTVTLQNKQLFTEQTLAHELKMREIMLEDDLSKQVLRVKARNIILKGRISIVERNELVSLLNQLRKNQAFTITTSNLDKAVINFSKKYIGRPMKVTVDHVMAPVESLLQGSSVRDIGLNMFTGYKGLIGL
jgi:hypothetical protein